MSFISRLRNVFTARRVEGDLADEQRFHLESRVDDLVRAGRSRERAEAEARRSLGNGLSLREASRDVKLLPWLDSLLRDARVGVRMLRKDAIVSGAAVVSLGLALGACAAAFSLVDALMLRPLPVADPQRLVSLTFPTPSSDRPYGESFSYPIFVHMRQALRRELDLFLVSGRNVRHMVLPGGDGQRERVHVQLVSGNAFGVLGVRPAAGRLLGADDDVNPGGHPVAVLSHAFWMRRFGGDPAVLGRQIAVETRSLQIVGIAESGFTGIEPGVAIDLWMPSMMQDPRSFTANEWNWFRILGRLRPDVDLARAQAVAQPAFTDIRREIAKTFGSRPRDAIDRYVRTRLELRSAATGPSPLRVRFERPLLVLSIVAALVLLIAASNVANLLLARAAARGREMALRVSIGAGRGRLIQQLLVESALLAALAAALALVVAALAAPVVLRMLAPADDPVFLDLRIDGRLIAFLVGASTLTTVLFGLVPALRASGVAPIGAAGAAAGRVSARAGLLEPLVAVEVAVSVTVLFVAGLMLLSFGKLLRVDPGFDKDGVLLAVITASPSPSAPLEPSQAPLLQAQLLARIRSLPGVQSASVSAWPMFIDGGWTNGVRIPGRPPNDADPVVHLAVSPGFIATMRMRLLEGRELQTGDRETPLGSPVVVNQAFARRYFGRERVVGERYLRPGVGQVIGQEIVGVVADARYNNLREPAPPTVFVPLNGLGTLQVRTAGDPLALTASVRREVRAVHPAFWVSSVSLQSSLVDNALLRERLLAVLSAFFGGIGLLLAAVGLYGVLSYAVVQRTREIGIRLALGAPRAAVVRAMLARVGAMTTIGVVVGIGGGLFLARFIRAWLFEVQPLDAWSLMLPIVALLTAGLLAALRPARRASRVDPVIALRAE